MSFKPVIAEKAPFVCEEKQGTTKFWCACGLSQNQPYCDGSHKREKTGMSPVKVEFSEDKKVAWCRCKQTKTPPFCDGSHRSC
ncbi:MAG TPA: CDGSH iron-sulfur domain-containing protein [Leptospiraceae bacterium]|nr:CDGSH iron-sulfur domain-containing protein [Leptospirales bacterium]HMU85530.1 CDGSH iron-sulfur domain-containing protein [Leptospiraceae bacterium]HMX55860.1 CDGSH iron-sulfur domain-containing protein [Leptospiraceae bacterium]HMY43937.1 CDGSH iron-sulfur domain-containing protein [Leptospiraceae bacterium]HMZ36327.1 CDGSH iron-sulfur domain-containing protein [Leptospiraceae bacterium]